MKKIRNAHVILVGNLLENGHLARHGDGMTALRQGDCDPNEDGTQSRDYPRTVKGRLRYGN
jgi:hypothetical protein